MPDVISIEEFLRKSHDRPVIDVRSPSEFNKGHICGAINVCLFNDEERALIGKLYHQKSPADALNKGMDMISPKLSHLVKEAEIISPLKKVLVHCWRGGIRSESFAFLLETAGFEVSTLAGGYKSYRNLVVSSFKKKARLLMIGGMTGSGKTTFLRMIAEKGVQVIDLESLACHKGSVFGAIGEKEQPTTEQFQNNLFDSWRHLDLHKIILIEDENISIGSVNLPGDLYSQMRDAPLINLISGQADRANSLVKEYSSDNDGELCAAIRRIERRLGNEHMNSALKAIAQKDYIKAALIMLAYYDKTYLADLAKRPSSMIFPLEIKLDKEKTTEDIMRLISKISVSKMTFQ